MRTTIVLDHNIRSAIVLGGSYFLGPAIVTALHDAGLAVTVVNRGSRKFANIRQIVADRNAVDQMRIAAEIIGQTDMLVDLSCYRSLQAEIALSTFGKLVARWIHISSAAVYAAPLWPPVSENGALGGGAAWGSYGREKSEADVWLQKHGGVLPLSILRPVYAYGPGSYLDRETHIWSRALRGRPVLLSGDGTTRFQVIHRDDLADAVLAASVITTSGVHVYNVAHERVHTLRDFATACLRVADVDVPIITEAECHAALGTFATHQHRDPTDSSRRIAAFEATPMCLKVEAIQQQLGWSATRSLEEGLQQTFLAYTPSRLREASIRTDAEDRLLRGYRTRDASR